MVTHVYDDEHVWWYNAGEILIPTDEYSLEKPINYIVIFPLVLSNHSVLRYVPFFKLCDRGT